MVRILNGVQGGLGLVVFLGALSGISLWLVCLCAAMDIFVAIIIAVALREESSKGRMRETIELCISFFLGLGGAFYLMVVKDVPHTAAAPWWFALIGLSLMLMNWGAYVGVVLRICSWVLTNAALFLEFFSGENLAQTKGG